MNSFPAQRSRAAQLLLIILILPLGLASRRYGAWLPAWVVAYAGDTLWALLVFWLIGFWWVRWPAWRVAGAAWVFSVLIEVSQLYQAPWLNAVRNTTLGSLVLGHSFLWSDLVCYTVGIGIGYSLEYFAHWKQAAAINRGRVGHVR